VVGRQRICATRLVPFLPELVPTLERHGHLVVTDEVRAQLLELSPATVDRLLPTASAAWAEHDETSGSRPVATAPNSTVRPALRSSMLQPAAE
jgi:hypothetical protein